MRKQGKNNVKIARKTARGPMKAMVSPSILKVNLSHLAYFDTLGAHTLWHNLPMCGHYKLSRPFRGRAFKAVAETDLTLPRFLYSLHTLEPRCFVCCDQAAVAMGLRARLARAKLALLSRSSTASWTTDSEYLLRAEFSFHGCREIIPQNQCTRMVNLGHFMR
jgi:hypothetical protein